MYTMLAATTASAAVGSFIGLGLGSGFSFLGALLSLGLLFLLASTRGQINASRIGYMLAFGFCTGVSSSRLIGLAYAIDPSIIVSAFAATTAIFASFSAAALLAERRSYLFLGGALGSALSMVGEGVGGWVGIGKFQHQDEGARWNACVVNQLTPPPPPLPSSPDACHVPDQHLPGLRRHLPGTALSWPRRGLFALMSTSPFPSPLPSSSPPPHLPPVLRIHHLRHPAYCREVQPGRPRLHLALA